MKNNKERVRCVAVYEPFYGRTGSCISAGEIYRFFPDGAPKEYLQLCSKEELYFSNHPDGFNQPCFQDS